MRPDWTSSQRLQRSRSKLKRLLPAYRRYRAGWSKPPCIAESRQRTIIAAPSNCIGATARQPSFSRRSQPTCGRRIRLWRGRRGPNRSSGADHEFRPGRLALRIRLFVREVFRPDRWFAGMARYDRRRREQTEPASASSRCLLRALI